MNQYHIIVAAVDYQPHLYSHVAYFPVSLDVLQTMIYTHIQLYFCLVIRFLMRT